VLDDVQIRGSVLSRELTLAGTVRRDHKRTCVREDFDFLRVAISGFNAKSPGTWVFFDRERYPSPHGVQIGASHASCSGNRLGLALPVQIDRIERANSLTLLASVAAPRAFRELPVRSGSWLPICLLSLVVLFARTCALWTHSGLTPLAAG